MKPFRLILTPEQTALVRSQGLRWVVGSSFLTGKTGLAVLNLFEVDRETANEACGVVFGTRRAVKIGPATPSQKSA